MKTYSIILTPDAKKDLETLDENISYELDMPDLAAEYLRGIKEELVSLKTSPRRVPLLEDGPWRSAGVHKFSNPDFAIFFYVEEEEGEVYVLNILSQKSGQNDVLSRPYDKEMR